MPEKILGLDIGVCSIKAVLVTAGLKGYQISHWIRIPIEEAGGLEPALKAVFENTAMRGGICLTSLPASVFSFRTLSLPFKNRKKIQQTIAYELEPLLPYPLGDVFIDYTFVKQDEASIMLAAAVRKGVVEQLVDLLRNHHIEISAIDIGSIPIVAKLLQSLQEQEGPQLLLDIGTEHTACVFFRHGAIAQIRDLPFGGATVTRILTQAFNIGWDEAEKKKIQGVSGTVESDIRRKYREFFTEVTDTLQFLALKGESDIDVTKVFLTGGGSLCPILKQEAEASFDVPVDLINVAAINGVGIEMETEREWIPAFMNQALALATRDVHRGCGFNFAQGEFASKKSYEKYIKKIRLVASSSMLLAVAFAANWYADYHFKLTYAHKLKQEIVTVFQKTCPEVTRIVDPVQQLKVKVEKLRQSLMDRNGDASGITVLDVLKDISRLVPDSARFLITSLTFDGAAVDVKGETDTFNTVDAIKKYLGESTCFKNVSISSASLTKKGDRVGFDLRLELNNS